MAEIVIITPELESGGGGVGDYARRLLETWGSRGDFRLLVASGSLRDSGAAYPIKRLAASRNAIFSQLPSRGGKVLVQYSAYGFDRIGYPRALLHALIDWKKYRENRLIIVFHEIWGFW